MRAAIIFFSLIICLASPAISDNLDEGNENVVSELTKSMPYISQDQLRHGKFVVKRQEKFFNISYVVKKASVFSRKLPYSGMDRSSNYKFGIIDVVSIDEGGYSCLLIKPRSAFKQSKSVSIVYPNTSAGGFLNIWISVDDYKYIDGAKDKKRFVILEYVDPPPSRSCFSSADEQYYNKKIIASFSPETRTMTDISVNFPKYYRKLAIDYRKNYEDLKKHGVTFWPECEDYINNRIADYENIASGQTSVSHPYPPPPPPPPPPPVSFVNKCGVCHGLDRAIAHKQTREKWGEIINEMMRKKEGWISPQEGQEIFEWLSLVYGR